MQKVLKTRQVGLEIFTVRHPVHLSCTQFEGGGSHVDTVLLVGTFQYCDGGLQTSADQAADPPIAHMLLLLHILSLA